MITRTWSFAAAGLLFVGGAELATDYTASRSLRYASEMSMELETTSMLFDGQPREGMGGMSSAQTRALEWTDRVLEHKDGTPTKVQRVFGELKQGMTMAFGDNENTSEREGELVGVTLELTRGEDGKVEAKALEGDASGDALLGHSLTLLADVFLPEKAVEAGDSWDLESDAIKRALAVDLNRAIFPPQESSGGEGGGGERRGRGMRGSASTSLMANADFEGKATLSKDVEEHDGVECRVIKLEFEAEGTLEEPSFGGGRGRAFGLEFAGLVETTYTLEMEGKLLFDPTKKLPVLFVLEGEATIESNRSVEREGQTMTMSSTQEGTIKFESSVTVEKS
jgi:hypothetical protein